MRDGERIGDSHDGPVAAYDRTVDRLAADLQPVHRVWPFRSRVAIWVACAVALVLGSTLVTPRPDLASYLARPMARLEMGLLLAVLAGCGALALRGATPGQAPAARAWGLAGIGIAIVAGLGFLGPVDQSVSLEHFIAHGLPCAAMTLVLAGLAACVPLVMVGRGFPLAPGATGAIAGLAGAVTAVLAMRLHCPMDEVSHQLIFHASALFPVVLTGALAMWAWQRLKTES